MINRLLPAMPSSEEIAACLALFGAQLLAPQIDSLRKYLKILLQWNQLVSLTSLDDPLEIVSRHFGESLFGGHLLSISTSGRLADVGSGAGFPGIPLKIAYPSLDVTLIEPNLKKYAFLTEVVGSLGLSGIDIFRGGYADFPKQGKKFDFICSRALGQYKTLLRWSRQALTDDGSAVLWVGEEDSKLLAQAKGWNWQTPTRIPESRKRLILIGKPTHGI